MVDFRLDFLEVADWEGLSRCIGTVFAIFFILTKSLRNLIIADVRFN
jgi:hypothetical protein